LVYSFSSHKQRVVTAESDVMSQVAPGTKTQNHSADDTAAAAAESADSRRVTMTTHHESQQTTSLTTTIATTTNLHDCCVVRFIPAGGRYQN
jgi:hypothetical protein